MRSVASILCVVSLSVSAGCLNTPSDSFNTTANVSNNTIANSPNNTANNDQNNGSNNGTSGPNNTTSENNESNNGSTNAAPSCADCTIGETRCDGGSFQQCVNDGDEGADCPQWVTLEACSGAQMCDAEDGCVCDTSCELTGEIECLPNGAFVCMMVDNCPRSVRIDRDSSCAPPSSGVLNCSQNTTDPYCAPCANGRGCVAICDGTSFYACGG